MKNWVLLSFALGFAHPAAADVMAHIEVGPSRVSGVGAVMVPALTSNPETLMRITSQIGLVMSAPKLDLSSPRIGVGQAVEPQVSLRITTPLTVLGVPLLGFQRRVSAQELQGLLTNNRKVSITKETQTDYIVTHRLYENLYHSYVRSFQPKNAPIRVETTSEKRTISSLQELVNWSSEQGLISAP